MQLTDQEMRILNSILISTPLNQVFRVSDLVFNLYPNAISERGLVIEENDIPTIRELCVVSRNIHREMLNNGYLEFISQANPFSLSGRENTPYIKLTEAGRKLKQVGNYEIYMQKITSETHRIEVLETKAAQMAHRQYIVNVWIAVATSAAVMLGFFPAYKEYLELKEKHPQNYLFLQELFLTALIALVLTSTLLIHLKNNRE